MKKQLFTFVIICLSAHLHAQKIDFLPASRFAPQPVTGVDYLKDHIKLTINYPSDLLATKESGEVFIRFLVDNEGVVKQSKISSSTNEKLNAEAMHYFNSIVWKKDYTRRVNPDILDGIRIKFDAKYFSKIAKKRGYLTTQELVEAPISGSAQIYPSEQVDKQPILKSAESMNTFAAENLNYPQEAITRKVGGVVKYKFVIEPYGLATNFDLLKAVPGGCNEETMRLLKEMRWNPAIKDGKAVRTWMEFSLLFNASGSGGYQMYDGNSNSSN